jgi:protein-S-isoprenylcysteine O-methyltransferase Ste14
MGDAPRLVLIAAPALLVATVLTVFFPDAFSFTMRFRGVFLSIAVILGAVALPFWASAAYELVRAWKEKRLATGGAYALCRHPIFAVWIFFLLPIAAFVFDSWLFLAADAVFVVASIIGARREEQELVAEFGEEYEAYRSRVRLLVPVPRLRPLTGRRIGRGIGGLALLAAYCLAVFVFAAIPVARRLGATGAEARMPLPGDELTPRPRMAYTQGITIDAPPEQVWPWLVQVGYRRAGWYNVDAINRLVGPDYFIDGHGSSNRIHPELQDLQVGDGVSLVPGLTFDVTALEKHRYFVIGKGLNEGVPRDDPAFYNVSWVFHLTPVSESSTRLLARFRVEFHGGFFKNFWNYVINDLGGAMLQQPAMLHGVKLRAEGGRL